MSENISKNQVKRTVFYTKDGIVQGQYMSIMKKNIRRPYDVSNGQYFTKDPFLPMQATKKRGKRVWVFLKSFHFTITFNFPIIDLYEVSKHSCFLKKKKI